MATARCSVTGLLRSGSLDLEGWGPTDQLGWRSSGCSPQVGSHRFEAGPAVFGDEIQATCSRGVH